MKIKFERYGLWKGEDGCWYEYVIDYENDKEYFRNLEYGNIEDNFKRLSEDVVEVM